MEIQDRIVIAAPLERVFDLAARVERWPDLLRHYRYVHVLAGDPPCRVVEMAAHRDGLPVHWTAIQEILPEQSKIRFRHIRGATRGMAVEWHLEMHGDLTHVTISHRFDRPWPIVGPLFARWIVGEVFVRNIAGKTLRQIKAHAEQVGSRSERAI